MQQPAAPVHVIHAGPRSTLQDLGYQDMTPVYYEADIRPGQSVVMPGFTISIEAARDPQRAVADRLPPSQPVVTVTPAEGDDRLMTMTEQDFYPRRQQDQQQHHHPQQQQHQQQQQPVSEHHPLAGIMRGQHARQQQYGVDGSQYRMADGPTDGSSEPDSTSKLPPQQPPASSYHHPAGVAYSTQQAPAAAAAAANRPQPGDVMEQQRPRVDHAGWTPQSEMATAHAAFTETRPAIGLDNVQVLPDSTYRLLSTLRLLTHAPEIGATGLNSTPDSVAGFSCQCTTSNVIDRLRGRNLASNLWRRFLKRVSGA